MPTRIQRKRSKGWKMPPNTVYVGRPSRWGNPFTVHTGIPGDAEVAVALFRDYLKRAPDQKGVAEAIKMLRGKNLACWCPIGSPCHADVLLELANKKGVVNEARGFRLAALTGQAKKGGA